MARIEYFKDYRFEAVTDTARVTTFVDRVLSGKATASLGLTPKRLGVFSGNLYHDGLGSPLEHYDGQIGGGGIDRSHPKWVNLDPQAVTAAYTTTGYGQLELLVSRPSNCNCLTRKLVNSAGLPR